MPLPNRTVRKLKREPRVEGWQGDGKRKPGSQQKSRLPSKLTILLTGLDVDLVAQSELYDAVADAAVTLVDLGES